MSTSIRYVVGSLALSVALSGFAQSIKVVDQPRPLAHASEMLEHKYGILINYEDPRYVFSQDLTDLTASGAVSQKPNSPHIIVPKAGSLTFSTNLVPTGKRVSAEKARGIVAKLLSAYQASANSGNFTFSQTADIFTIFPTQAKDRNGIAQATTPILSTPVSLDQQKVTTLEALEILCAKINDAIGRQEVGLGTIPMNILQQHTIELSASNEPARNVLEQILTAAGQGNVNTQCRLVWQLFYGPDMNRYALNIHIAQQERPEPTGKNPKRLLPIQ